MNTYRKFSTNLIDNWAYAFALVAAALCIVALLATGIDASEPPVERLDPIVVTASRLPTVQLDTMVVVAPRESGAVMLAALQ